MKNLIQVFYKGKELDNGNFYLKGENGGGERVVDIQDAKIEHIQDIVDVYFYICKEHMHEVQDIKTDEYKGFEYLDTNDLCCYCKDCEGLKSTFVGFVPVASGDIAITINGKGISHNETKKENSKMRVLELVNVSDREGNISRFGFEKDLHKIVKRVVERNREYYGINLSSKEGDGEIVVTKERFEISESLKKYIVIETLENEEYAEILLPLDSANAEKLIDFSKSAPNYDDSDLFSLIELIGGKTNRYEGERLYW